jgi:hypothetical protein
VKPVETLYPLGDDRWVVVVPLDAKRYRLDIYRQEEELVPPFLLDSVTLELTSDHPARPEGLSPLGEPA